MDAKNKAWALTALVAAGLGTYWYYRGVRVGSYVSFEPEAIASPVDIKDIHKDIPPGAHLIMLVNGIDADQIRGTLVALEYKGQFERGSGIPLAVKKSQVQGTGKPPV